MQQTSELFDIIHFEAPQIQKFYDDFLQASHTPKKQKLILKIVSSPRNTTHLKLYKERQNDLFNELLEQETRFKSPFSIQRTPKLLHFPHNPVSKNNFLNKGLQNPAFESLKRLTQESLKENNENFQSKSLISVTKTKENPLLKLFPLSLMSEPPVKLSLEKSSEEIKKRKRKSNLQLKVLKLELEKATFWDKDKITAVSQSTGLSESQVYKWFWDQKKKKSEITRENYEKKKMFIRKNEELEDLEQFDEKKKAIKKNFEGFERNLYKSARENERISKKLKFENE